MIMQLPPARSDYRAVNVSSIVAGEYAENELRKDFTPMERVAIGKTLEKEIGKRKPGPKASQELRDSGPAIQGRVRDTVARQIGFGSGKQYERAKQVEAKGPAVAGTAATPLANGLRGRDGSGPWTPHRSCSSLRDSMPLGLKS